MRIGIVNYGCGNLTSVKNIFRYLGFDVTYINKPIDNSSFSGIVLPGVGAFDQGVKGLRSTGLYEYLIEESKLNTPLLGICLGMQLLCKSSEEGELEGLGLIDATVKKIPTGVNERLVPHLGWNFVFDPFSSFSRSRDRYYFAHSYYVDPVDLNIVTGTTNYKGFKFTSSFASKSIIGAQFHPEKSHRYGMRFLDSFVRAESAS